MGPPEGIILAIVGVGFCVVVSTLCVSMWRQWLDMTEDVKEIRKHLETIAGKK